MELHQNYRIPFSQDKTWKKHLQEQGFVVISQYLPKLQCEKYVQMFWDIMEKLSLGKLDRNNPETQILSKCYPPVLHGGMIQYVGHSQVQWELRIIAKQLFEKIWGTNNLKSSYDGFCFMNGKRNYQQRSHDAFLHCDQSPTRDCLWSYQGIQTLTDSGENQGGFVCVPKSHKYHQEYFVSKSLQDHKQDWFIVPEEDRKCEPFNQHIKLNTKAGDFILWDSRTFHCNTVPTDKNALRICTYICMLPADKTTQKIGKKRRLGVTTRRTSGHHPGDGFDLFPGLPRYLQSETKNQFVTRLKEVNDFKTDELIEELI